MHDEVMKTVYREKATDLELLTDTVLLHWTAIAIQNNYHEYGFIY